MADVLVNALTPIATEPISTDSIVCVNRSTNEGEIIDYNLLADKILDKLTSKTYSGLDTTAKIIPDAIDELRGISKRLSPITSISENANLNSYTTPGEYYCGTNTIAATISNSPVIKAFRLTVEQATSPTGTQNIRQILREYQKNVTHTRWTSTTGSTWSDWYTDDAIIPFHLGNAASYSFRMRNNFAAIFVKREGNYQLLFLDYWWGNAATVITNGNNLLTVTKAGNSYDVTITNNVSTQTVGFIFNPSADLRVS